MSEQRRPTARFGRSRAKDPRVDDSVPPAREAEVVERPPSDRPTPRSRKTDAELHAFAAPPPSIRSKRPTDRVSDLESELEHERAERAAEADLLGQILARATQAEARVKILEQTLARVNEERAMAESQLQAVRSEIDGLLADKKATYTAQTSSLSPDPPRGSDSRPQLRAMRALARDLLQSLDTILGSASSLPPPASSRSPTSDRPASSRSPTTDRPASSHGKRPTLRPRSGR